VANRTEFAPSSGHQVRAAPKAAKALNLRDKPSRYRSIYVYLDTDLLLVFLLLNYPPPAMPSPRSAPPDRGPLLCVH
jgi:hypothetical protein